MIEKDKTADARGFAEAAPAPATPADHPTREAARQGFAAEPVAVPPKEADDGAARR